MPHPTLNIKTLVVGPLQTNCYLVTPKNNKQTIIIDPGWEAQRIINKIKENQLEPIAIVCTHTHVDHIGAANHLEKHLQTPVYAHPAEKPLLNTHIKMGAAIGLKTNPPKNLVDITEKQKIELGEEKLEVLHTPGHTPGSITLHTKNIAFVGDTLFQGSIGRTDFPGGSHTQLITTIKTKILTLGENTQIYPGHGLKTTIAKEKSYNPFLILPF